MTSGSSALKASSNKTEFILRRLHSLSGLIPLGLFVVFHLTANNAAIKGPEAFNFVVNTLRSLPYLEFVELSILGIPILFHGLYGLIITPTAARTDLAKFSKVRNWTYYFQRVTGIVIFVFIAVHVWQFKFEEDLDYFHVANALRQPAWALAYAVGILATVYHFANGLWNFFISWGITTGKKAQQVSGAICLALGLGLLVIGMSALWAFYSSDLTPESYAQKKLLKPKVEVSTVVKDSVETLPTAINSSSTAAPVEQPNAVAPIATFNNTATEPSAAVTPAAKTANVPATNVPATQAVPPAKK